MSGRPWIVANVCELLIDPSGELLALLQRLSCRAGALDVAPDQFIRRIPGRLLRLQAVKVGTRCRRSHARALLEIRLGCRI